MAIKSLVQSKYIPVLVLCALVVFGGVAFNKVSFGDPLKVTSTGTTTTVKGNLGVRFRIGAKGQNQEAIEEIDDAIMIHFANLFVRITRQEDVGVITNVMIPRENLLYLKYWNLDPPEGQ